ncbi:Hypoxia-inducible factor-1 [Novymonas esmeraldas]|uniref:Hypoxia-inducible factor-1 n=1 Tax=Novymonas esmeraldas TaxID=1808958 RepID=A0AAW0EUE7_9TRYP
MEVYRRITERVRGALWAHHRRLMPERQFHRILAYVYNNKYEYQIRFDRMSVVGRAWGGRVEVMTTPAGFLKRVRVNPAVEDLSPAQQHKLVLAAYADACQQGRVLMEQAELTVYKQFLMDLKPIILGIRDNPEFYTVPEDSIETIGGVLRRSTASRDGGDAVWRTIPMAKAHQPVDEVRRRHAWEEEWLASPPGQRWARSLRGKEYFARHGPQYRPRGAPGAKTRALPFEMLAPYTPMDEGRLLKKNWMAYMDNKHVAESLWTRAKVADREKQLRLLQERGQAWHRPINAGDATQRW